MLLWSIGLASYWETLLDSTWVGSVILGINIYKFCFIKKTKIFMYSFQAFGSYETIVLYNQRQATKKCQNTPKSSFIYQNTPFIHVWIFPKPKRIRIYLLLNLVDWAKVDLADPFSTVGQSKFIITNYVHECIYEPIQNEESRI